MQISACYLQLGTITLKQEINMMQSLKNPLAVLALAGIAFLSSCKKTDLSSENLSPTAATPVPASPSTTSADGLKDSALLYSKDIYLWYGQIPATFNARSYSDLNLEMEAIRQYSNEPGFSGAVDKWSFAVKQDEWDNVSSGVSIGDFGLNVFFRAEGDLRVKLVERESPAGKAGVRRGWRITAINGNSNMVTSNADFIVTNLYESSNASVTFEKPDKSTVTLNLNAGYYNEHPVLLDSIYTVASKKIGYFSFNSFLGDTTEIYNEFSRVFNKFASSGVNDVIVDLRYNGGGYVTVQEKLANWLAPSTANGQLMMKQQFNDNNHEQRNIHPIHNKAFKLKKQETCSVVHLFFLWSEKMNCRNLSLVINLFSSFGGIIFPFCLCFLPRYVIFLLRLDFITVILCATNGSFHIFILRVAAFIFRIRGKVSRIRMISFCF